MDTDRYAEEQRTVAMEAVRERGHDEDGDEIHDPDGSGEETELDACKGLICSADDDCCVVLDTDADADDSKVHEEQWPEAPVHEDREEVLPFPASTMINPRQIFVVDLGILAGQGRFALGNPFVPAFPF